MTARTLQIETFLRQRKCTLPDIGMLQPADPILNAAGEDIRRRIFMTADQRGRDMCLRPEFTIPACLGHIKGGMAKKRYGYVGEVFRQRVDEPAEFMQAGIEDIGAANRIAADAKSLLDAVELVRLLGQKRLSVTIGDQAIFNEVLKSLAIPKAWQERLSRNFGDPQRLAGDLDRLSGATSHEMPNLPAKLAAALAERDRPQVIAIIEASLRKAGLANQSGRSAGEIAGRLIDKAELAATRLPDNQREILEAFLRLDLRLDEAGSRLRDFARKSHLPLGDALAAFQKRASAIEKLQLENVALRYRASFGRRLDYYTGFVFEISAPGAAAKPLAGGGRYDHLLNVLGARGEVPAVGFGVYVDRVAARAKGAGA
jgi:ATP phosphoribosyltransferase regulatory subunit